MTEIGEKELIYLGQNGDKKAVELLLNNHINLIRKMAVSCTKYGAVFEDLVQEGCIGVIQAINNFDLEKEVKFATYATYYIKMALSKYLYNNRLIKLSKTQYLNLRKYVNDKSLLTKELGCEPTLEQLSKKTGLSISKISELENFQVDTISFNTPLNEKNTLESILCYDEDIEDTIMNKDKNEILYKIIEKCDLNPRDLTILKLRFGLDGNVPMSCDSIGSMLGVTGEAIRLKEKTILKKLRRMKETYYLSIYMDNPKEACEFITR